MSNTAHLHAVETPTATVTPIRSEAENAIMHLQHRYDELGQQRQTYVRALNRRVIESGRIVPTQLDALVRVNAEYNVFAQVDAMIQSAEHADGATPAIVARAVRRQVLRQITRQDALPSSSGTCNDADAAERATWKQVLASLPDLP